MKKFQNQKMVINTSFLLVILIICLCPTNFMEPGKSPVISETAVNNIESLTELDLEMDELATEEVSTYYTPIIPEDLQINLHRKEKEEFITESVTYSSQIFSIDFINREDQTQSPVIPLETFEVIVEDHGNSWVLNPIIINDNGGFDYTWEEAALQPWCGGEGTEENPYYIENVTIDAGGIGSCLTIQDSEVHFRIENCTFYNAGSNFPDAGITIEQSENGVLIKNNCSYNSHHGILVTNSKNTIIKENLLRNNVGTGVDLDYSLGVKLEANKFTKNGWVGINLFFSNECMILDNLV